MKYEQIIMQYTIINIVVILYIETVEDTSRMMRLLVTWKTKYPEQPKVNVMLVEHDNELVLDEDKLVKLYDKVNDMPSEMYNRTFKYDGIYRSTWLMCNNIVLDVAHEITCEKGCGLKVTISEGVKGEDARSALWIDSER
jgi:hypothetical protein